MQKNKKNTPIEYIAGLQTSLLSRLKSFDDQVALQDTSRRYSYSDLVVITRDIADFLLQQKANSQTVIAIEMGRSIELVMIVLACALQGLPFLLINANWPDAKKQRLLQLVAPQLHITLDGERINYVNHGLEFCVKKNTEFVQKINPHFDHCNDYIAYLATSSGSSGEIKCAMMGGKGLLELMIHQSDFFQLDAGKTILQIANPGFDAIVSEIFVSLWGGAKLIIVSAIDTLLIPQINLIMSNHEVDLVTMTPSVAQKIPTQILLTIKTLVLAGELASAELIKPLLNKIKIINAFGPCETTVCSHMNIIQHPQDYNCIGRPLSHITAKVMNEFGDEIDDGEGELWIYGDAVGYGYLGLNQQNFGYDHDLNMRFYKTGDIVQWGLNNQLYYVGRKDFHIKIRGQKVNIHEITHTALQLNTIENAFSFYEDDQLILMYQGACSQAELSAHLKLYLSEASIPKTLIHLSTIPLNENGKADLLQLQRIASEFLQNKVAQIHSNHSMSILEEILGQRNINLEDDFFDAGGDSLKLIDLMTRYQDLTGREMDLSTFLANPKLKNFIQLLDDEKEVEQPIKLLEKQLSIIEQWQYQSSEKSFFKTIIMTGVTGRVGQSIAAGILEYTDLQIICLGRGSSSRLCQLITERFQHIKDVEKRLKWINCDFNDQHSVEACFNQLLLTNGFDAIIHCGANVNHIFSFADLYAVNVTSTFKLLEFAYKKAIPRFIYISSTSARSPENETGEDLGYDLSKGASQELVKAARMKGMEASYVRLPLVFDLHLPDENIMLSDHFLCRTKQCLEMNAVPQTMDKVMVISAQDCGRALALMCNYANILAEEYTFIFDEGFCWKSWVISLAGSQLEVIPYDQWQLKLFANQDKKMPLTPFLSLYKKGGPFYKNTLPIVNNLHNGISEFKKFLTEMNIGMMTSDEVVNELVSNFSF